MKSIQFHRIRVHVHSFLMLILLLLVFATPTFAAPVGDQNPAQFIDGQTALMVNRDFLYEGSLKISQNEIKPVTKKFEGIVNGYGWSD